jgi:phosphoribosylaminoimidazolecarboxamide formyltransferase/IMP cyclohydrolase
MADEPLREASFEGRLHITCKYGENGYQVPAALYSSGSADPLSLDRFRIVAGTEPSYNNLCDLDRLLQTVTHIAASFELNRGRVPLVSVGVKHGNPCGAAVSPGDPAEAARKMILGDPLAIFGGLVMLTYPVSEEVAEALVTHGMPPGQRRPLDGIAAPAFEEGAVGLFKRKGDKCRLLENPELQGLGLKSLDTSPRFRCVRGGFLMQPNYTFVLDLRDPELRRYGSATPGQEDDMLLAKAIGDTSNSNTVTLVKDGMLLANGVGQQARVRGSRLAVNLAGYSGHDPEGASASSDSFFPFTDGVEVLREAGVKAVVATSGSVKDAEVKGYCEENGIALYHIPDRKARGFFGH